MNGDIIRRIRQYHEYIAHYYTAGNPGQANSTIPRRSIIRPFSRKY